MNYLKFYTTGVIAVVSFSGFIMLLTTSINPQAILTGVFCIFTTGWAVIKQWGNDPRY